MRRTPRTRRCGPQAPSLEHGSSFESSHLRSQLLNFPAMPKASRKGPARRSRSFGGCGTCRRRHVKCDQVRPICLTCKAVGAECEGFSAEIRWMKSSKDGNEPEDAMLAGKSGATRRHLFSGKYFSHRSSQGGCHIADCDFRKRARKNEFLLGLEFPDRLSRRIFVRAGQ